MRRKHLPGDIVTIKKNVNRGLGWEEFPGSKHRVRGLPSDDTVGIRVNVIVPWGTEPIDLTIGEDEIEDIEG